MMIKTKKFCKRLFFRLIVVLIISMIASIIVFAVPTKYLDENIVFKKERLIRSVDSLQRNVDSLLRNNHSSLPRTDDSAWITRDIELCQPVSNIAYLKSHKTGSTAVQTMLFRYGIKKNLTFVLAKKPYFSFDKPFNRKMVYPQRMIGKVKFNIFAVHCVWNIEEIKFLMPEDTIYIGSVREPVEIFISLFDYFNFQEKSGMPIDEFVRNVSDFTEGIMKFHGYHQLVHDFGFTKEQLNNNETVQNLIKKADENFQLVLVTERMEESLILLRHLLCWTYEDIAVFKVNTRLDEFKSEISKETRTIIKKRQQQDYMLYNHFKKKLEKLIQDFGETRMKAEVNELRKVTSRIEESCQLTLDRADMLTGKQKVWSNKVRSLNVVSQNISEECLLYSFSEHSLIEYAREKQNKRLEL